MEHICVHVAIEGTSEAWEPLSDRLRAAPDVRLVAGQGAGVRVDVIFYDVDDGAAVEQFSEPDDRREFWTIGVDLKGRQVIALAGSQFALTSVDDLAAVIRASGCALRPLRPAKRLETGD